MTQTLPQTKAENTLTSPNLVTWRIRRSRAEIRETQVHRQLLARLHEDKNLN